MVDKYDVNSLAGYGLFVNSSDGGVSLESSQILENGGDGVRYVSHEHRTSNRHNILELCTLPTTSAQTFPLMIALQQSEFSANSKECHKVNVNVFLMVINQYKRQVY